MSNFTRSTVVKARIPQAMADSIKGNPDKWARSALIVCELVQHGIPAFVSDDEPGMACVSWDAVPIYQLADFRDRFGFRMRVDGDKKRVVIG